MLVKEDAKSSFIGKQFIDGVWVKGQGEIFESQNPATKETIWQGESANIEGINNAVMAAKDALPGWSLLLTEERIKFLERFTESLNLHKRELVETIAKETGKPLWDAETEFSAMVNKLPITREAYEERCKTMDVALPEGRLALQHKPLGILAVFGAFNFPAHLPNGHIIPALLAGNVVVLKQSGLTPLVAEKVLQCWQEADLPAGVINLIQGRGQTGVLLAKHPELNGLLFTGSYKTGKSLLQQFSAYPEKILALEMGGNNPMVVGSVNNINAAVFRIIQSAYISAGQRCTCARRLILIKSAENKKLVVVLIKAIQTIQVGPYTLEPEPFIGPVISNEAASDIVKSYDNLVKMGGKPLVPLLRPQSDLPFIKPGLLDVTAIAALPDEEIFGPLLQLIWVDNFEAAIIEANRTQYGLVAGILSDDESLFKAFQQKVRAGLINWNQPTTGASSRAPFGGLGHSGNYRPSAYYAVDYCAYPVASLTDANLTFPKKLLPGFQV